MKVRIPKTKETEENKPVSYSIAKVKLSSLYGKCVRKGCYK